MSRVTSAEILVGSSECGSAQIARSRDCTLTVTQIVHVDAVGLSVREMGVVLPLSGEVRVDLNHMPNVDHEQEGRITVFDRKGAGVVLGLSAGGEEDLVPSSRTPLGLSGLSVSSILWKELELGYVQLGDVALGGLFGFENEAAPAITIDPPRRPGTIGVLEVDAPLEDVIVQVVLFGRHGWLRKRQGHTQPFDEQLIVREFRPA